MGITLEGRVALVTGGLRGIGRAVVQRFIEEGADVWAVDLDPPDSAEVGKLLTAFPAKITYRQHDAADDNEWRATVRLLEDRVGRLDILVNNVGIGSNGSIGNLTLKDWQLVMRCNVESAFLGIHICLDLLESGGALTPVGSSIVNVSSIFGIVGFPNASAYAASKGALRAMTKALAVEFARTRKPIRVNSLHPGFVQTPLFDAGMAESSDDDIQAVLRDQIPMGRIGMPVEIAAAAMFLAGDDSSYVTGAELVVDGGWVAQ